MSTAFVGEIRMFAFPRIPVGWLPCDGSLQPITSYEVLFSKIGTTFGGDGVTTFGLPDLRGRVPVHQGQGPGLHMRSMGELGGAEAVTLASVELPVHNHGFNATQGAATAPTPGGGVVFGSLGETDTQYLTITTGATALPLQSNACTVAGRSQPHNNTMPTTTVSFCIAYEGEVPTPPAD